MTQTIQMINAENLEAGDDIVTGSYVTTNEQGDDVRHPIYETVAGIILKADCVEVVTADHPGYPINYAYGKSVKTLR